MKLSAEKFYCPQQKRHVIVHKINCRKTYHPEGNFSKDIIEKAFDFAYGMTFGADGYHRSYRTGGIKRRHNRQIFADTFQGKLGEFALYSTLQESGIDVEKPDVSMYGKGLWDHSDLNYNHFKISIKSTKSFGQLMLLEAADWTADALYIPNIGTGNEIYDFFVLVRIEQFATDFIKHGQTYESNEVKARLKQTFLQQNFTYDIPGCMSRKTLIALIEKGYIVKQGDYINKYSHGNRLDANNYYIQAGNLFPIEQLIEELKRSKL